MQQLLVTARITKIGLLQQLRCTGCWVMGSPTWNLTGIPEADSNCSKCLHVSRKNIDWNIETWYTFLHWYVIWTCNLAKQNHFNQPRKFWWLFFNLQKQRFFTAPNFFAAAARCGNVRHSSWYTAVWRARWGTVQWHKRSDILGEKIRSGAWIGRI